MKLKAGNYCIVLFFALIVFACKKEDKPHVNDSREQEVSIGGKSYPVKVIGNQIWTIANYSGEGGVFIQSDVSKPEYGKYYTVNEAKAIVLPDGWRLPTANDFRKLCNSAGITLNGNGSVETFAAKRLMSNAGWVDGNGTNETGFDAYPAGYDFNSLPIGQGKFCRFWTTDQIQEMPAYFSIRNDAGILSVSLKSIGNVQWLPLRFVKDNVSNQMLRQ